MKPINVGIITLGLTFTAMMITLAVMHQEICTEQQSNTYYCE